MSAITSLFVTPADGALRFTWDVCGTLISTTNINSITIVYSDAAIPGAASSAIKSVSITPTVTSNPVSGVPAVVKNYTLTGLTNGTRYVTSLTISTIDSAGAISSYTNNSPVGLLTPGTVPQKPIFTAYPVSTGIRLKLLKPDGTASYEPRSASDGFYGIRSIKYFLSSGTGFESISDSSVLAVSLTPDSTVDDVRDARVAYDNEFAINNLVTNTKFELAIQTTNALGDSLISDTISLTTGTDVQQQTPVAVSTLEYNRYNVVSANADVVDAATATVLFTQAQNTDTLKTEGFPVLGYNIYRQDVSSNGTSLLPFTKVQVGSITGSISIDSSGNAVGGQNQYKYGLYPYNATLISDTANSYNNYIKSYTFKFVDSGVVLGKYYSYTIRGFNAKGEGSEDNYSICRIASKAEAPIVVAEPSNNLITLNITNTPFNGYSMADVSGNFNYYVDVSGQSSSVVVKDASGNVALTAANFNTIVNGGLDKVTVAAITRNQIPSTSGPQWQTYTGKSTILNVRPYTNPSAPSGLTLNQIENGAPISGGCLAEWSLLSDASRNGNTGAITYNVYVGGVLVADKLVLPKYKITGLTNGVQYGVTVAASIFNTDISAQVVGVQSSSATFKPFSLPGPATAVDLSNSAVSLNTLSAFWSVPADTSLYGLGAGAIRYKYELTDMSSGEVVDSSLNLAAQKGPIASLNSGILYKLDVYSGVSFANVVYYNTSSVSAYRTIYIKPAAPSALALYPLDGRLRCTWDSAAANGVTMTGYDIYINNGTTSGVPAYVSSTPYSIEYFIAETDGSGNNLVNGTAYKVIVGAKGTVQNGTFTPTDVSGVLSSEVSGTPNVGPASPVISESIAGEGTATVKWPPIPNASGYLVFQNDDLTSDSGSSPTPALTAGRITVSPTIVTFTKSGLTNGKSYTFRVVAYTTVGALRITSSDDTRGVTIIVPYAAPDRVEKLDYSIGSETINLTWDAPINAGGAGLNQNGSLQYKVKITDEADTLIINQSGLTTRTWSQTGGFLNNRTYKVYVSAYYTGANGTVYTSSDATINKVVPNPVPKQISNLTAVPGDHSVKLNWTNPDDGYLYSRTKIAIWKSTNGGRYKLYRISSADDTSFEDKEVAGLKRLTDNTVDTEANLASLTTGSNSVLIAKDQLVNGFTYKYKVTSLFDRNSEGAQLPDPVETATVSPNGKPIVSSIRYETFTGEYVVTVSANGGKLKDWLFMGISTTAADTPVFQGTVPLNAVGTGNRDTTNQIAGNNTFELRIGSGKTFDNHLFVINNGAGIEIEVASPINDTN
jgi:hypothetical protein